MSTVQACIDDDILDQAMAVLDRWGLSVSDAIRILLTRTAREGRPPIELLSPSIEHELWFRSQVAVALEDETEIDDEAVSGEFAARRANARNRRD